MNVEREDDMESITYSIENFKLGLCIPMGNGGTWWRVLEVNREDETAVLIADKVICYKRYHESWGHITWENCTLRKWLNEDYFEKTFSEEEKAAIIEADISNQDNAKFGTKGGNNTKDKIWLLSLDEVQIYFKDNADRATGERWWLRSPGYRQSNAACVFGSGGVDDDGSTVNYGYGVRPAFKINLKSSFFQSLISDSTNLKIKVAECIIEDNILIQVNPYLKKIVIPEGVTGIADGCFRNMEKLKTVTFPSTLKKIGEKAFYGCSKLEKITGTNGALAYGKDAFYGCKKLKYTPEMFHNTGKLCDSFAENMKLCGPEEYAWVLMYQKGAAWDAALPAMVNAENASEILIYMTKHISEMKKPHKKATTAASAFVIENAILLHAEGIEKLLETLKSKKMSELAEQLQADPAVASVMGMEKQEENPADAELQVVQPDGSIWYGSVYAPVANGTCFRMGAEGTNWRILSIDETGNTALMIADEIICQKAYHEKRKSTTWENCTLRKWLNEDYFEQTFSDEEKAAIVETDISNLGNANYKTKGGNNTKDKIWLLSLDEVQTYFRGAADRATDARWWLRSPGYYQGNAACVLLSGAVGDRGNIEYYTNGVRPAFKINLKSSFFQSLLSSNQNGEAVIDNPKLVIKAGKVICADRNCTEVKLPAFAKEIEEGAFKKCAAITKLTWDGEMPKIHKDAFISCPNLKLPEEVYLGKKLPHENLAEYIPENAGAALIANLLILSNKKSWYLAKAIELLNNANAAEVTDEILRVTAGMKKPKSVDTIFRFAFAVAQVIDDERMEKLIAILSGYPKYKDSIRILRREMEVESAGAGIVKAFFTIPAGMFSYGEMENEICNVLPGLSAILAVAGDYAEMYNNGWVDASEFKKAASGSYRKLTEADQAAKRMDHAALMTVLKKWQSAGGPKWYAPYAAFANETELADLMKEMKLWTKDKILKERIIRVRGAILLNDSNAAMRYADSLGLLGQYAAIRGLDEDTVRDSMMSDMGLDETGHKIWTLAGKQYLLTLNKDLTLTLTDEDGKVLRSIPKKGADPDEHAVINKEYSAIKKDIKPTAKLRNDKIFADFLSGRKRDGAAWKKAYLKNPLLRLLAQLIVWEQDGTTFVLKDDGHAYDADGNLYEIIEDEISVAHPMEMGEEVTAKWQEYFISSKLSQPFEQVWEPVTDASLVQAGRYDGCRIPLYALMNKEKHGIIMEGQSRITLKDCSANLELIEGHHDWYNNDFEVKNFSFEKYTRQVNHIVAHLDKATVAGRIKKDDVSVAQWLDRFTAAQIREFVDLATENNATNVAALLLQYQQEHFAAEEFDAFDVFTLDLL